jgi:hypothetical protein
MAIRDYIARYLPLPPAAQRMQIFCPELEALHEAGGVSAVVCEIAMPTERAHARASFLLCV